MADYTVIRGPVSTGDRDSVMKKEERRRSVYKQLPMGKTPVMKMLKLMPSKPTRRSIVDWSYDPYVASNGTVTDVYTDAALSSAYASGGVDGTPLFLKVSADDANLRVVGQTLQITDTANMVSVPAEIIGVTVNGSSSALAVKLLAADSTSALAESALTWEVIGNAHEEMSPLPDGVYREPIWLQNVAQIFMAAVEMSGTELAEEDVIDETMYRRYVAQSYDSLMESMELAVILGTQKKGTGASGRNKFYMGGLKPFITSYASSNVKNWKTDSSYAGETWLAKGWDFMENYMVQLARYSANRKTALVGDLAHLAINQLVEDRGTFNMTSETNEFGIRVKRLVGLNTELDLIQHPLFSMNDNRRRSMMVIEPELLRYRPMRGRDIQFVKSEQLRGNQKVENGFTWIDGIKDGWYGQVTMEFDNAEAMGWVDNLGVLNTAT